MFSIFSRFGWGTRSMLGLAFAVLFIVSMPGLTSATKQLVLLSDDPYTNSAGQHKTEVEPDTFSFGSTVVSTFQVGRFTDGGSSNIGWATSIDGGKSWTHDFLPGLTKIAGGSYDRATDPSVAYDAKDKVWMIVSLGILINSGNVVGTAILVSRSSDGLKWDNPVTVATSEFFDKTWIVCDSTATSPFYGHCYIEWDDHIAGNLIVMGTSADAGAHWNTALTADQAQGIGGQPLVQPNGIVVVPIDNAGESALLAFISTDGGASWSNTVVLSDIRNHPVAGGLRAEPLISAEIDGAGNVFVVWQDCRFEPNCAANDIVFITFTVSKTPAHPIAKPSAVRRIPMRRFASSSPPDAFIPSIGIDKSTSGSSAHLVVTFFYYPAADCTFATCQLNLAYASSTDGGATFTPAVTIAGPMSLAWLPDTTQGRMVGDYMSTSFIDTGVAFPVFPVAVAPTGGSDCSSSGVTCNEAMNTVMSGLASHAGLLEVKAEKEVVGPQPTLSTPQTAF
jgi:hypothetical protein